MALLLVLAAGFARLGIWQLSRLHQRRGANRITLAARSAAPVRLPGPALRRPDTLAEHRLIARGRYDHDHDIVLRGEALQGVPGVHLVTPLRMAGTDTALLVDRGFVPAPDAVSVQPERLREPGEIVAEGTAVPVGTGGGKPIVHAGRTTWARLDLPALRSQLPYPVLPVYLRQTPGPGVPSFPRRLEPPPIDEGPHLSYAIQWFLFAGLAAAFAFLVVGRQT
ncbi:MAG TPA: SURF1 family protein [Gemmatimonadales bacterium]|jgi:surfeit locus 1 family protein|nr:SURF1 family protein [Gemmatimonadales bacterium]